jgi:hypothetical protein
MEKFWQKVTKIFHLLPIRVNIHKICSLGVAKGYWVNLAFQRGKISIFPALQARKQR